MNFERKLLQLCIDIPFTLDITFSTCVLRDNLQFVLSFHRWSGAHSNSRHRASCPYGCPPPCGSLSYARPCT